MSAEDLSERAIALIMWERTRVSRLVHAAEASSAIRRYERERWHGLSESAMEESGDALDLEMSRVKGWGDWLDLCRQYLTDRGWEPLP